VFFSPVIVVAGRSHTAVLSTEWELLSPAEECWPAPATITGFGAATDAVRAVVAQAATVTGPVHGLLGQWRQYPWGRWQEPDAGWEWRIPYGLLPRLGRLEAFAALGDRLGRAFDAAGWSDGTVGQNGINSPRSVCRFALLGAAIADADPHRAALLRAMWDDAMPPGGLDAAAVRLWCSLRLGGATRDEASPRFRRSSWNQAQLVSGAGAMASTPASPREAPGVPLRP
jgi:hypothetical protein